MAKQLDREKLKIKTPAFRGSYVHLLKARAYGKNDPKFSLTPVLDGDNPFWDDIEDRIHLLVEANGWGTDFVDPIKDGDTVNKKTGKPRYPGCLYFIASNPDRVEVIGMDGEEIVDRSEIYSGAWYKAIVRPYAWEHNETSRQGVSISLDSVLRIPTPAGEDDTPFGSKSDARGDFSDEIEGGAETRPRRRRGKRGSDTALD